MPEAKNDCGLGFRVLGFWALGISSLRFLGFGGFGIWVWGLGFEA